MRLPSNLAWPRVRICLTVYFGIWIVFFVVRTLHWRQVNDPAQIHYVCFLIDHGMSPYRDIIEMNMPGIYLVNWSVMHTIGGGSFAWRIFDLGLMLMAGAACISIARTYDWFAGIFAAALFILYHGRDGAGQQGQRDLIIAVLLLAAYAFLFRAVRRIETWPMLGFGLCCGWAATIKPTPLPFAIVLLLLAALWLKSRGRSVAGPLGWAFAGIVAPFAIVLGFLVSEHSVGAFLHVVERVLPYYSTVGRITFTQLFGLSSTASVQTVLCIALIIAIMTRGAWNWERSLLFFGFLFGVASFFGQGKGFPYHRYPMFAFLFLWSALQIVPALRRPGIAGKLAITGLLFGVVLAPLYAIKAAHRMWSPAFIDSLTGDLQALGGTALSGHVQCIYMQAACDATLYRLHLVQATGQFYDFFLFGPDKNSVIEENRSRFWVQLQRNVPQVMIVGEGLYPNGTGYGKLLRWPLFNNFLEQNYSLWDERSFPRDEAGVSGYRVYVKKSDGAENPAGVAKDRAMGNR